MSGRYQAILNISRTGRVALMQLDSKSEETLLCIREQSMSRGAIQSALRRRWLSLCTVWPSHSQWPNEQIIFITTVCLPFYSTRAGFFFFAKHHITQFFQPLYNPHLAFPKAKIAIEREGVCECDGHAMHKLSQRHLTANWLAPRKSDCSRMHSKVSSCRLSVYVKATQPVLEIFKMAG